MSGHSGPWLRTAAAAAVTRARDAARYLRHEGVRTAANRALLEGGQRAFHPIPFDLDVRPADVLAEPMAADRRASRPGQPLAINWVINPPSESSGGMGTIMRACRLLEERGHSCHFYVMYTGYQRHLGRHRALLRSTFPGVQASLDDVDGGMRPADAVLATAWPTAYVVRSRPTTGTRFYFVQDFEPLFYPTGTNSTLAAETYRFGFHGITAGPWLATKLEREFGMVSDHFELGVDLSCYHLGGSTGRPGPAGRPAIVFYARPETARRGFELGMMALELFARRHPDVVVHLVGADVRLHKAPFVFVNHGVLSPVALAALYRDCTAALVLSLTNLSLLPAELLACGCIPVMNDAEHTRIGCPNPYARFATPSPAALAAELGHVIDHPPGPDERRAAAASVAGLSWDLVADQLEGAITRGLARDAH